MASVTARISQITQPRGGYIKPSEFKELLFNDGNMLGEENIHASVVGMAVDYLTRYMTSKNNGMNDEENVRTAFAISIEGYDRRVGFLGKKVVSQDQKDKVDLEYLLKQIAGLDDSSIIAACKLSTYDVWFRNPRDATLAKTAAETNPDNQTVKNIRIMVERSLEFWKKYGPIVEDGFTFEYDGYTKVVDSGDGDYLTKDTMWDFKVSKSKPNNKHTLQLLMYWIMGQHSGKAEFKSIKKLGIFNPRLNAIYIYDVNNLSKDIIREVEKEVICY